MVRLKYTANIVPDTTLVGYAGSQAIGIAAHDDKGVLVPFKFTRRAPGPKDISIQVAKVGICHGDYHLVFNDWKNSAYPIVPG